MKVQCTKCQKVYTIDRSRYPDKGGKVSCKQCDGHVIIPPMSPKTDVDITILTCPGCGKQYRVPTVKIPETLTRVACKACGHDIPVRSHEQQPFDIPVGVPAASSEDEYAYDQTDDEGYEEAGVWDRYKWWFIGGAGVLAVIILALCLILPRGSKPTPYLAEDTQRTAAPEERHVPTPAPSNRQRHTVQYIRTEDTALGPMEPYGVVRVSVGRIVETLADMNDLPMEASTTLAMVQQLGLNHAELYILPDATYTVLPGLVLRFASAEALSAVFSEQGPASTFLEPLEESLYKINAEVLAAAAGPDEVVQSDLDTLPLDRYRVWLSGQQAFLMPEAVLNGVRSNPEAFAGAQARKLIAKAEASNHWIELFMFVPNNLHTQWRSAVDKALQESVPDANEREEIQMMVDMFSPPITEALERVSRLEAIHWVVDIQDATRSILLNFHFRDESTAESAHQVVTQAFQQLEAPPQDVQMPAVQGLLAQPWMHREVVLSGRSLSGRFSWEQVHDANVIQAAMESVR